MKQFQEGKILKDKNSKKVKIETGKVEKLLT